jgi:hypothetical protein
MNELAYLLSPLLSTSVDYGPADMLEFDQA